MPIDVTRGEKVKNALRCGRLQVIQIVAANAIPVVGVWVLGWQPVKPIFFYWVDGLLAAWGLGVVAAVVTGRQGPNRLAASGMKLWLTRIAAVLCIMIILAVPSVFVAMYLVGSLHRVAGEVLPGMLADPSVWISLGIVVWSSIGQTIGELRSEPDLTLKKTGEARVNLFIHRTIAMALLVFWGRSSQPSRSTLAAYVLVVAGLFTYTQLHPERYLQLIGFRKIRPNR